jgi:ABC-type amino acid transport substrate-binding protein
LSLEQLERLQVYLIVYVLVALLVSLWVLPGLVAALTPIRIPDMFRLTRDALLTAFVAGDLFIVLPVLIDASKTLLSDLRPDPGTVALPDVIVPASFNFPHAGKLLSISFILFAGWFADAAVSIGDYPRLAFTGLVSFFGSLNVAVPFLLDLFRIPADTFQLFLASGVVNSRFGTLVAAVHTLAVALIGSCAMAGLLRWNRQALVRYAVITAVLTTAVIGGTRALFASALSQKYTKDQVLASMQFLRGGGSAVVHNTTPLAAPPAEGTSQLDAIRSRGALLVGFLPDSLPYAFVNARNDLVGFDVEMAYRLAGELGVRLELIPMDRQRMDNDLEEGAVDIVMSGVAVTTLRSSQSLFSDAYLDETFSFVVPDAARESFMSWDTIRARTKLRVAVPNVSYYIEKLKTLVPRAEIRPITDFGAVFRAPMPEIDALAFPAERGSAWTLMYPAFSVVVPEPGVMKVPLAYPIARHDQAFATFINTWIDLKQKDGTVDDLYRYWILGHTQAAKAPRWSIIRNVLHWVE